ncbi:MAG: hypothetical protein HY344_01545 [Candidatus Levybacteria bacterium]|nr:hypothetical protein [Candidatus Levybacteria bacterium]
MKTLIKQKGQSLIEAIVALSAAVLIISAIAVAVLTSVGNSDYSKNQNKATLYAQEELESLRESSEISWSNFSSQGSGIYCVGSNEVLESSVSNCSTANLDNYYIRQVDLYDFNTSGCTNSRKVRVSVFWSDGKCQSGQFCHNVVLESCFADNNTLPTP